MGIHKNTRTDLQPAALTIPQVAATLALSQASVRRRIADGELRAVRIGWMTPERNRYPAI